MNWRTSSIVFVFLIFFSCKEEAKESQASKDPSNYYSTKHLIEVEELQAILVGEDIKIIDFRKTEEYDGGHIPNALNIWRPHIEDESLPYKGVMAHPREIEKELSNLGIRQNDIIIIYDDRGLCDAARLWWVLKTHNFEHIKLLNGGWSSWKSGSGTVSTDVPVVNPSNFTFKGKPSLDMHIDREKLRAVLADEKIVLIDSRTVDEYSGKRQKSGAQKGGRIPGSIHIDWMNAVEMNTFQKFKSRAELEKVYDLDPALKDNTIVTYCHTGVRSAHTTFVLTELLGYTNVKNYDGSWSEWSYFDDLPIEKDSITSIY